MLNLINLAQGQKVRLRTGAVGEVTENMGDGIWVQLRMLDGQAAGEEELVHCEEIADLAEPA